MNKKELFSELDFDLSKLERFRYNFELDYKFKEVCNKKYEDWFQFIQYYSSNMNKNDRKEYCKKLSYFYNYNKLQRKVR